MGAGHYSTGNGQAGSALATACQLRPCYCPGHAGGDTLKDLLPLIPLIAAGCCRGQVCDECPFPVLLYVADANSEALLPEDAVVVDAPTCGMTVWRSDHVELGARWTKTTRSPSTPRATRLRC